MREFTLSNDWYACDMKMFKKKNIVLKEGLTVLVGCNGAGKTTLLKQIRESLKCENIPFIDYSYFERGERVMRQKYLSKGDFEALANLVSSSEGERMIDVASNLFFKIGELKRKNPNAKEYWILIDAVDSGLSIDNIIEFKKSIEFVINDMKDTDVYFIVSANSYELARKEKCLMVENGKYTRFFSYEDYRNYILDSRDYKNKRDGGWRL